MDPYLVKCQDHGLMIVYKESRVWAQVVTRNASEVYTKQVRLSELELCSNEFEYPGGIEAAAERFLHPSLGIAIVNEKARKVLEDIMKNYTSKSNAKRALAKIGDYALSKADEFIIKNADGSFDLNDTDAECYQYDAVTLGPDMADQKRKGAPAKKERQVKHYRIIPGCDFSKRRGGFRLTLDAINSGCRTVDDIHHYITGKVVGYKRADIYTDISMGRKYGYVTED